MKIDVAVVAVVVVAAVVVVVVCDINGTSLFQELLLGKTFFSLASEFRP